MGAAGVDLVESLEGGGGAGVEMGGKGGDEVGAGEGLGGEVGVVVEF